MSDNTQLNQGNYGDVIRTVDKSGKKTQVVVLDVGGSGAESLASLSSPLPTLGMGINYLQTGYVAPFVDPLHNCVVVLDEEHSKIHQGKLFTLAKRVNIANVGGVATFLGIVPAAVYPHFRNITVSSDGGPFDVDFYEGTTVSANGAAIAAYNNNRNATTVPGLLVYDTPTITADGILLEPILIPGTKQSGSLGSDSSNEWILKENTKYLIRITNNTTGAGTSRFTINMFWYE